MKRNCGEKEAPPCYSQVMTFGYHPAAARIYTHTYRTTNLLFSALAHPDPLLVGTGPSTLDHFKDELKTQLRDLTWQRRQPPK